MRIHEAVAVEHHALAISAWTFVARASERGDGPNLVAATVATARRCSQLAIDYDTNPDPDWGDLGGAMLDAEVEHAIQCHADAIAFVVGAVRKD